MFTRSSDFTSRSEYIRMRWDFCSNSAIYTTFVAACEMYLNFESFSPSLFSINMFLCFGWPFFMDLYRVSFYSGVYLMHISSCWVWQRIQTWLRRFECPSVLDRVAWKRTNIQIEISPHTFLSKEGSFQEETLVQGDLLKDKVFNEEVRKGCRMFGYILCSQVQEATSANAPEQELDSKDLLFCVSWKDTREVELSEPHRTRPDGQGRRRAPTRAESTM